MLFRLNRVKLDHLILHIYIYIVAGTDTHMEGSTNRLSSYFHIIMYLYASY